MLKKLSLSLMVGAASILLAAPLALAALELPQAPSEDQYIFDYAKVLNPSTVASLHYQLESLEKDTGTEIAVVTVDSLQDYPIEEFAIELARKWGIGQKENDNGLLLLIAPNEREVRVEVGYGLEGAITDAQSSLIIRRAIIPHFKNSDYDSGVVEGVKHLEELARQEEFTLIDTATDELPDISDGFYILLYLLPFIWILLSWFSSSKGWWAGGIFGGIIGIIIAGLSGLISGAVIGLGLDYILSTFFFGKIKPPRGGGGFFGGGGSSGGGFGGGFGGGGFGGGGASGRW